MAEILEHPDKDRNPSKEIFELDEGTITIEIHEGKELTIYQILGMLEMVKASILKCMLED